MQKITNAFKILGIMTDSYGMPINKKYLEDAEFADENIKQKYLNKIKFCSLQKEDIKTSNLSEEEKANKIEEMDKNIDVYNISFEEIRTEEKRKEYIKKYREYIEKQREELYKENKAIVKIQEAIQNMAKNGANKNVKVVSRREKENHTEEIKIDQGYFMQNRDKQGNINNYVVQEDEYGMIEYLGHFRYRTNINNITKTIGKYRIVIDGEEIEFFYNNGFHILGIRDTGKNTKQEAEILGKVLKANPNMKRILYEIINQEMKITSKEDIINVGLLKRNNEGIVRITSEEKEIAIKAYQKRQKIINERKEEENCQR